MSPIEVRHRVRAQPIDLESGIVFRNGRADFVEDVHKVLSRIADRTESALRHARYACSTRAIELRDRAPELAADLRRIADRLSRGAARALTVTQPARQRTWARLEPSITDLAGRLQELDARFEVRKHMRVTCRRAEARLGRMEFEEYMGAAIALVALAILVHGIIA